MFVDETGAFISPDLLIGFLGTYYFTLHPERRAGSSRVMTYDVRSSRGVVEFLEGLGAEPTICKVGHSFAKKLLRDTDGIAGGELAGTLLFPGELLLRLGNDRGPDHHGGPGGGRQALLPRSRRDRPLSFFRRDELHGAKRPGDPAAREIGLPRRARSPTWTEYGSTFPTGGSTCASPTPSPSFGWSWRPGRKRGSRKRKPSWWRKIRRYVRVAGSRRGALLLHYSGGITSCQPG